jgi:hypothetical protein
LFRDLDIDHATRLYPSKMMILKERRLPRQGQREAPRRLQAHCRARGKYKASVAVARKLLTLVFYALRGGEVRCLETAARVSATNRCVLDERRGPPSLGVAEVLIEPVGTWPNPIMSEIDE